MALILAIEPDREQAALLTSLIRTRLLSAELVLTDTTAQALVAIGDRVPDLVLIPALLSPQEDATLAGALRMIAAAAQVQMLTIPLLAAGAAAPERRGVLARWRRGKNAAARPAGCDPAVFADQIAGYLAEAAEKRAGDGAVEAVAEIPAVLAEVTQTPLVVETVTETPQVFAAVADALPAFVAETPAFAPVAAPPPSFEEAAYTPTVFEPAYTPTVVEPVVETPTVFAAVVETPIEVAAVAEAPPAFEVAYTPTVVESVVEIPIVLAEVAKAPIAFEVAYTPTVVEAVVESAPVFEAVVETPIVLAVVEAPAAFEVAYIPPVVETPTVAAVVATPIVVAPVAEIPIVIAPVAEIPVETIEVARPALSDVPAAASAPARVAVIKADEPTAPVKTPARRFALIDWQHAEVEAPAFSTPAVSDTPAALSAPQPVGVEGLAEAEEAFAAEWGDDPMVRAIKQFVSSPIVAERTSRAEPVMQPVHETAAAPALSDARSVGVEGPLASDPQLTLSDAQLALSDVSFIGVEGSIGVEGPALSDAHAIGVEGPALSAAIVEAAPVAESIVSEPIAHQAEALKVATVEEVEDDVLINFDETPVYELSLDELASDAALMASIDAMMAPRLKDQAKPVRPQASQLAAPAPEKSVERQASSSAPSTSVAKPEKREDPVIEPTAAVAAKTVLVSQRAVEMPAAESGPIERIPQLQTEPDPLFFCDAEPAALAIEARVPRAPVVPVRAAAPVAPVRAATPVAPAPVAAPVARVAVAAPAPPAAIATAAAPAAAKPEWVELIESLRKDIERLKAERTEPAAAAAPSEPPATVAAAVAAPDATAASAAAAAIAARKAKKAKPVAKTTPRPAQDEWGLFDPEQCGFASLLAKLSEITEGNDSAPPSRELNH